MSALFAFHLLAFVLIDGRRVAMLDRGPVGTREQCEITISKMFDGLRDDRGVLPGGSIVLGAACKVPGIET